MHYHLNLIHSKVAVQKKKNEKEFHFSYIRNGYVNVCVPLHLLICIRIVFVVDKK